VMRAEKPETRTRSRDERSNYTVLYHAKQLFSVAERVDISSDLRAVLPCARAWRGRRSDEMALARSRSLALCRRNNYRWQALPGMAKRDLTPPGLPAAAAASKATLPGLWRCTLHPGSALPQAQQRGDRSISLLFLLFFSEEGQRRIHCSKAFWSVPFRPVTLTGRQS
jgi:hypothetical protein